MGFFSPLISLLLIGFNLTMWYITGYGFLETLIYYVLWVSAKCDMLFSIVGFFYNVIDSGNVGFYAYLIYFLYLVSYRLMTHSGKHGFLCSWIYFLYLGFYRLMIHSGNMGFYDHLIYCLIMDFFYNMINLFFFGFLLRNGYSPDPPVPPI